LDDANRLGITYSAMVNSAGNVVLPSVDSLLFAVYERGAQPIASQISAGIATTNMNTVGLYSYVRHNHIILLLLAHCIICNNHSWPLTLPSFVAMRTNTYRDTCKVKTELVRFWYW
jgi:hypothetical protein